MQVTVRDIDFVIRKVGKGPKIVLLHGFGGRPSDWWEVAKPLSKYYEVLMPNLSPLFSSSEPLSFSTQVNYLRELMEQIVPDGEQAHLVGASYGGTLSFGLRLKGAGNIASHTLFNPMPFEPINSLKHIDLKLLLRLAEFPGVLMLYSMLPFSYKTFQALGKLFFPGKPMAKEKVNKRKLKIVYKALKRFIWVDATENWDEWKQAYIESEVPATMFYSSRDQLFSRATFLKICQQFSSCSVKVMKGKKHLVTRTHPEYVADLLLTHLEELSVEASKAA